MIHYSTHQTKRISSISISIPTHNNKYKLIKFPPKHQQATTPEFQTLLVLKAPEFQTKVKKP
jgi:hypothetical protein